MADQDELLNALHGQFGDLRAEYLDDRLFDLFSQPSYWPQLLTAQPCVLEGGRGTGKTTVLRGLSYQGMWRMNQLPPEHWKLVGLYWRIDTSVVTAFEGAGLDDAAWTRYFDHYANLVMAQSLAEFVAWRKQELGTDTNFDPKSLRRACRTLHIAEVNDVVDLVDVIEDAIADFEDVVNNIQSDSDCLLSLRGRPIRHLCQAIKADTSLRALPIVFLIDEYENLLNYQQRIFNTLLKHSSLNDFSFKIGVKETGFRERSTVKSNEVVIAPADYSLLQIADAWGDADFADFAARVCNNRLQGLVSEPNWDVRQLLPSIPPADEAIELGVTRRNKKIEEALRRQGATPSELSHFHNLDPLMQYFVGYWATAQKTTEILMQRDLIENPKEWMVRLGNYQYAMLFTIQQFSGLDKFYAGYRTFAQLANGNVRYLLQLVSTSLNYHVKAGGTLLQPVSPKQQTDAAVQVGQQVLQQLQGVSSQSGQLMKLVLSLGRIFGVLAAEPEGHAPEVNQFRVAYSASSESPTDDDVAENILNLATMHLAVVRFPGNKNGRASADTKEFDYQLHPMFAPFFSFSHRRKRRLLLTSTDVATMLTDHRDTISRVLTRQNRARRNPEIPAQLELFRDFYGE